MDTLADLGLPCHIFPEYLFSHDTTHLNLARPGGNILIADSFRFANVLAQRPCLLKAVIRLLYSMLLTTHTQKSAQAISESSDYCPTTFIMDIAIPVFS